MCYDHSSSHATREWRREYFIVGVGSHVGQRGNGQARECMGWGFRSCMQMRWGSVVMAMPRGGALLTGEVGVISMTIQQDDKMEREEE